YTLHSTFTVDLQTYDDGTTFVRITRYDDTLSANCKKNLNNSQSRGVEQILRIRVIQLNGTVIEINLDHDFQIDPINY
ncbi:20769_t:CDS:1, partial [Gigaspora rosea]